MARRGGLRRRMDALRTEIDGAISDVEKFLDRTEFEERAEVDQEFYAALDLARDALGHISGQITDLGKNLEKVSSDISECASDLEFSIEKACESLLDFVSEEGR